MDLFLESNHCVSTTTNTIFTRWNFGYKRKEKMVVVKKSIVFSMLLFFDKRNEEGKKSWQKTARSSTLLWFH